MRYSKSWTQALKEVQEQVGVRKVDFADGVTPDIEPDIEEAKIPEGLSKEGAAEFMAAASAAKKAGKKSFKFGDKEYPVTIKVDIPSSKKEETDLEEKMFSGKGEFEVKYASSKKGPIKVSRFNTLEDAKKFLAQVKKEGMNGIISKGGKPVKEENIEEKFKKGKYTVRDGNTGKVIATYSSGEKASKEMHKLMDSGKYSELEVKMESVKEELDDEDKPVLKKVIKGLKKASQSHAGQAADLEKSMKESMALQMKMAADDIETYAKKHGGIDKKDMMKAAAMLKKGDKAGALKFIKTLDTDPRDYLLKTMGEEVEIDEKKSDYEDQIKAYLAKGGKIQKGDKPNQKKIDKVTKGFLKKLGIMKKKEAELDAKDKEELEKMMGEESIDEKKGSDYELYHKTFSGAMQHAYAHAKKKGFTVDPDEIDNKVATGPKKPSKGKTNRYILGTDKKKNLHVQVANLDDKRFELNMYIEEVTFEGTDIDEAISAADRKARGRQMGITNRKASTQKKKELNKKRSMPLRDAILKGRKKARTIIMQKVAGKGKDLASMSPQEKDKLEDKTDKRIKSMGAKYKAMAKKFAKEIIKKHNQAKADAGKKEE